MQSLLRWSIENSQVRDGASGEQGANQPSGPQRSMQFDPEIINAIMGRPDSEIMKDALAVATNVEKNEDERLQALDDFEMLVENIDNANNIDNMGMWSKLQELLTSTTSSDSIRAATLWVIGTAVQNNPAAQKAFLSLPGSPLSALLARLSPEESSSKTRSKAVYALSGLLKHNARGVELLKISEGWKVLKSALEDPDITVRRKTVFLLSSLLLPSVTPPSSVSAVEPTSIRIHGTDAINSNEPRQTEHPNSHAGMTAEATTTSHITSTALEKYRIVGDLVQALVNPLPHGKDGDEEGDPDLEEKLIRLFYTYLASAGGHLDENDKRTLSSWIRDRRTKGEDWDLGNVELDALETTLVSNNTINT